MLATTQAAQAQPNDLIVNPGESIQAAIDAANNSDTIFITAGRYTESLTLSKPVSLMGADRDTTILHAIEGQRVLTVTGATISNSVVISGLTFTGGNLSGQYCPAQCGGGMLFTEMAQPIIKHVALTNNVASAGGGLWALDAPALTIMDSQFISNTAGLGGGIVADSALTLTNVTFLSNTASDGSGGLLAAGTSVTLIDTDFIANHGGAVIGIDDVVTPTVRISGGQFSGNSAGGLTLNGSLEMSGTHVVNNADGSGLSVNRAATITNSTFISNAFGGSGGGLYAGEAITLTNVTFISNTAQQTGGGAFISGIATLIDADFISNTSFEGGGGLEATSADITRGNFEANTTSGHDLGMGAYGCGGGVEAITMTMTATHFISNTAIYGGGAATYVSHISGGRFERNVALSGSGGGLLNGGYLSDTVFISNSAVWGGGLFSASPHSNTLLGVRFAGNHASSGGGGLASLDQNLLVTGTRFIRNTADNYGGGLAFGEGQARLVNNLFVDNISVHDGAAVALPEVGQMVIVNATIADSLDNPRAAVLNLNSTLRVTNTIIVNHAVGLRGSNGVSNTLGETTEDYNLFFGNITDTVGVITGAHSLIGDPKFVDPLHDDYHLRFGSAAIDHGVDAGVYTDLDGNPRPSGAGFDIGAYEYQLAPGSVVYLPLIFK